PYTIAQRKAQQSSVPGGAMQQLLLIGLLLFQAAPARPAGGSVTGRVAFADGAPVTGTMVRAVSLAPTGQPLPTLSPASSFTNTNGEFRLLNLAPGPYFIRLGFPTDA